MPLDLECPANYFGKGKNYLLPDDAETIREFERRFQEWEQAHPEDPTGELALAKWESEVGPINKSKPQSQLRGTTEEKTPEVSDEEIWKELELVMPERHIEKFKNYCRLQRRRPRDIMMLWIERLCKL